MLNELRRWLFDEYLWLRTVWVNRRGIPAVASLYRPSRFSVEDRIDLDELDAYRQQQQRLRGWSLVLPPALGPSPLTKIRNQIADRIMASVALEAFLFSHGRKR